MDYQEALGTKASDYNANQLSEVAIHRILIALEKEVKELRQQIRELKDQVHDLKHNKR